MAVNVIVARISPQLNQTYIIDTPHGRVTGTVIGFNGSHVLIRELNSSLPVSMAVPKDSIFYPYYQGGYTRRRSRSRSTRRRATRRSTGLKQ